ncbi:MAG TPA: glycosyltransferase [Chitinophagaceae bacterium]|nr:glycosyltransferase [Chitinophagaceae bacterium]
MSSPLVSVIIPVYNGERYVEETIRSVFDQTFQDFEIIILNDGSTDSSAEIIKRLQEEDSRIIYISKPNTGVSDTRNIGISKARGKYLAFLDADDVWKPVNLEKKIIALKDSGKKWVFCDHGNIYEEDNTLHADRKVFKPYNIIDNILLWEAHVVPGPCSNIVAEKELFADDIRFDIRLSSAADRDICLQLSAKEEPYYIPEKLWLYRQHGQSMSNQNYKVIDEMKYLYQKADKRKWFSSRRLRRKALSNVNLIMAGMSYFFPSQRKRIPGFIFKAIWYSPVNVFQKKILPVFRRSSNNKTKQ